MKKAWWLLIVLLVPFLFYGAEAVNINVCTNINSTDSYTLTADISNSAAVNCMVINASNSILNCNGSKIDGNNSFPYSVGVNVSAGTSNVTIQNCFVSDWARNILLEGNGTVENNIISSGQVGLDVISSANRITNNTINQSTIPISISGATSNNNNITNLTVSSSALFFSHSGAVNNFVKRLIAGFNMTFYPLNVNITNASSSTIPADPSGYRRLNSSISKYINITKNGASPSILLNISFSDGEMPRKLDNSIVIQRYNGTSWLNASNFTSTFLVDNRTNEVVANITDFVAAIPSLFGLFFANDTTYPTVDFVSPSDAAGNITQLCSIIANITATDDYLANVTVRVFNTSATFNTTVAESNIFLNYSGLKDGNYTLNATSVDTTLNENSTASRTIVLDCEIPTVSFQGGTPANENSVSSVFQVNITSADFHFRNVTLKNSTSVMDTCTTVGACNFTINSNHYPEDSRQLFTLTVHDTNRSVTIQRTWVIDNVKTSGSNGGGGGGGGVWLGETKTNLIVVGDTYAGKKTVQINTANVEKITLETSKYVAGITIKVAETTVGTAPPAAQFVFKYLEITSPQLDETSLKKATINFRVDRDWLDKNGLDKKTVKMVRLKNGAWETLKTTLETEYASSTYYVAETQGFSTFAIIAEKSPTVPALALIPTEAIKEGLSNWWRWIAAVIAVLFIIGLVVYYIWGSGVLSRLTP